MESFSLKACAKINLTLKITGLDSRGYHLLDTLMLALPVQDTLRFIPNAGDELRVECPTFPELSQKSTLHKAADLLRAEGISLPGCTVTVQKEIPVMAGMGGGSADAATALLGFCTLAGVVLDGKTLQRLALKIGADVPFMLQGGFARAKGVGELLEPLQMPKGIYILCAKGEAGLSTPAVYRRCDELGGESRVDNDAFLEALAAKDFALMRRYGGNDLQAAACSLCPQIETLVEKIYTAGAGYAAMTGSGAAAFGVFAAADAAQQACEALQRERYWAQVCAL